MQKPTSNPPKQTRQVKIDLNQKLRNRPPQQQLQQRRILKDAGMISVMKEKLQRAQVTDAVKNGLIKRSSIREVWQKGVFGSGQENPDYKEMKKMAMMDFLKSRPPLQSLVDSRIIQDTLTWSALPQMGQCAEKRNCHSSCIVNNRMYVFGGFGIQNETFLNIRVLDVDTNQWAVPQCAVAGVFPRNRYSSSCVVLGKQIIIFGGFSPEGYWLNDIHVLDTDCDDSRYTHMWYQPETTGTSPCPRAAHTCTAVGRKLFFFGGNDGQSLYDDLFILDTETFHWQKVNTQGTRPEARSGHSAILVKDMIVFFGGGGAGGNPMNDVHYLNMRTMTWSQPSLDGTGPSPRAGHTSCLLHKSRVLIFGGGYIDKVYNDVHMLDVERRKWSRPADTGDVPSARTGHSMEAIKSRIFVFGGCDSTGLIYNDLYLLDATFFRTQLRSIHSPVPNSPHFSPVVIPSPTRIAAITELSLDEQSRLNATLDNTGRAVMRLLDEVEDGIKEQQAEMKLNQQRMIAQVKMYHQSYEDAFLKLRTDVEDVKNLVISELVDLKSQLGVMMRSPRRQTEEMVDPTGVVIAMPPVSALSKRRSTQPQKPGLLPVQFTEDPLPTAAIFAEDGEERKQQAGLVVKKGDSYMKVPPAPATGGGFAASLPPAAKTEELPTSFFDNEAFETASMDEESTDGSYSSSTTASPEKTSLKSSALLSQWISRDMKEEDLNPPKKSRKRRRRKKKKRGKDIVSSTGTPPTAGLDQGYNYYTQQQPV